MSLSTQTLSIVRAGKVLVDNATLALQPGQITVLIGPNGAGKTTLLKALAGLLAPTSGTVFWQQTALGKIPPRLRAQKIAYLAQASEVVWPLEVETLVGLGRLPHRTFWAGPSHHDQTVVTRALSDCHVLELRHRLVPTLSGGERARVLLARALAGAPEVLLADEPLAGLDPKHQLAMIALFRSLAQQGLSLLITLHDLTLAARLADVVLLMHQGRIMAAGSSQAVLTPENLLAAYDVEAQIMPHPYGPILALRHNG